MSAQFISDLHLHSSRPEVTDCFLKFLGEATETTDSLYILGDLFETWIGDDDPDANHRKVIAALKKFTDTGRACFFAPGNRDFLVGHRFGRESGVQLLDEATIIDLHGERTLLLHGDELCTDDHAYQKFRFWMRNSIMQKTFLTLPLSARHHIAAKLRKSSMAETALKPEEITDVSQRTVEETMRHFNVRTLIHGHTHRPAIHSFAMNTDKATRIVLGDWYTQGSVLEWTSSGYSLKSLPLN
jgi:UDP-2,3-diacylglucosamine hydrolase